MNVDPERTRAHGRPPALVRRTRAGMRHADTDLPHEWVACVRRERMEALWMVVAGAAILLCALSFWQGFLWMLKLL